MQSAHDSNAEAFSCILESRPSAVMRMSSVPQEREKSMSRGKSMRRLDNDCRRISKISFVFIVMCAYNKVN